MLNSVLCLTAVLASSVLCSVATRANPLQDFVEAKIRENPDVVEAEQALRAAEATARLSVSVLYPTLSANWTASQNDSTDGFRNLLSLNGDQTLFGGGAEYSELSAARRGVDRANFDLADARDRVLAQYALAVTRVAIQKERLQVLRKVKLAQQDRMTELKRRFRLGQSREPDLLQVEVESSRLDRRISDTESAVDRFELELRNLLLLEPSDLAQLHSLLNPQDVRLLIVSLRTRPDYRVASLKLATEMLSDRERSAWLASLPRLGLYGQTNLVRPSSATNEWEWGLKASWTFFEGFKTPAEVATVQSQKIVAERKLFAFEHQKKTNLERLERDTSRAEVKKNGIIEDLKRAEKALKQQERDYRLSIVTELEVQQTIQSMLDLELELLDIQETRAQLKLQEFLGGEVVP
jgi:outer membrane protein TolC